MMSVSFCHLQRKAVEESSIMFKVINSQCYPYMLKSKEVMYCPHDETWVELAGAVSYYLSETQDAGGQSTAGHEDILGACGMIQGRVITGQSSGEDCTGSILMWSEDSHCLCVDIARESFENTCMVK